MQPSVSIVIPVFNRAHLVRRAIESALAQTIQCEVVVVDHGSSDAITSVVDDYRGRIIYVRRDQDSGAAAAWIDGVKHATGTFLHFTYDDDWIQPRFAEECSSALASDVAFVYTRAQLHDLGSDDTHILLRHPTGKRPIVDIVHFLLKEPLTISPGCALFRRTDVLDNLLDGIPNTSELLGKRSGVGEDLLLFLLTSLRYSSYFHIGEPLADFLSHDGSITVGAVRGGRGEQLALAYERAKQYYLSQPGAIQRPSTLGRQIFRTRWSLARKRLIR